MIDYENYYYSEIDETGRLSHFTSSTEMAEIWGYSNKISVNDVERDEDGWLYLKGYASKKSLDVLKEQKHAELKAIMKSKRNALTCEYDNDVFDCNEQAQSNMTSLMGFANLGMTEFSIRSTNERTHIFTSEQLVELATIMSKTVNDLYSEYWSLKDTLYNCETLEAIENIHWE